jgi:hypothetical protein
MSPRLTTLNLQFSMDMSSEAVKRVEDVRVLRAAQVRIRLIACKSSIRGVAADAFRSTNSNLCSHHWYRSGVQFPQDNSPMAHPIRPESYIAMDNFYTATVYNKGAEVIGIMSASPCFIGTVRRSDNSTKFSLNHMDCFRFFMFPIRVHLTRSADVEYCRSLACIRLF